MSKIVIASDSFKGCLTSSQIADGVGKAVLKCIPECEVVKLAVADGGEGTVDALLTTLCGEKLSVLCSDPIGRTVSAGYAILSDGVTAVIEMSSASGLTLLSPEERNPMFTSTYGTGQIIADALKRGCRNFLIGIGGSATNDAGMGMLEALGWRFFDKDGHLLRGCGASLDVAAKIDSSDVMPELNDAHFIVACDVDAPLYGPAGAAYVYAPQKGADPQMVEQLDKGLRHFAEVVIAFTGNDVAQLYGSGAAGGLGSAFKAFLNADFKRGADMVLDAMNFDEVIKGADLVITGEGKVDRQTLTGKLPYAVAMRAKAQSIPVIAVCGRAEIDKLPEFSRICQVTPHAMPLEEAMKPDTAIRNIESALAGVLI